MGTPASKRKTAPYLYWIFIAKFLEAERFFQYIIVLNEHCCRKCGKQLKNVIILENFVVT